MIHSLLVLSYSNLCIITQIGSIMLNTLKTNLSQPWNAIKYFYFAHVNTISPLPSPHMTCRLDVQLFTTKRKKLCNGVKHSIIFVTILNYLSTTDEHTMNTTL